MTEEELNKFRAINSAITTTVFVLMVGIWVWYAFDVRKESRLISDQLARLARGPVRGGDGAEQMRPRSVKVVPRETPGKEQQA